jgi:hypothetical protein
MAKQKLTEKEKEFQKLKRFVLKRAPGARTYLESDGSYILLDENGEHVVSNSLMLPPCKTVRAAWEQAKYALWFSNMMRKSNAAFSEEKIWKKLVKEHGNDE